MSAFLKVRGEASDAMEKAKSEFASHQSSAAVTAAIAMLDSLLDIYAIEFRDVNPVKLPEYQIAIKQVVAIRKTLANPDSRPTIF